MHSMFETQYAAKVYVNHKQNLGGGGGQREIKNLFKHLTLNLHFSLSTESDW